MVAAVTSDALLARVKRAAMMPTADGRLTDAEILTALDDVIDTQLGRAVYDADDGRWVETAADVAVTAGRSDYRLPERAWADGIRQVMLVDPTTGTEIPLDYVDLADAYELRNAGVWAAPAYTLVADAIRLLPTPADSAYSLRVAYLRQPSRLVAVSACALVSTVSSSTIGAAAALPSSMSGTEVVDVVRGTNGRVLETDVTVTASTPNLTRGAGAWGTSGIGAIVAGDYVCLAGETCVVPVPRVAIAYLVELGARQVCIDLGDAEGARDRAATAEEARKDMEQGIAERSRTRPAVINRFSPLRSAGMPRRGRWGR